LPNESGENHPLTSEPYNDYIKYVLACTLCGAYTVSYFAVPFQGMAPQFRSIDNFLCLLPRVPLKALSAILIAQRMIPGVQLIFLESICCPLTDLSSGKYGKNDLFDSLVRWDQESSGNLQSYGFVLVNSVFLERDMFF
jgi:hypothetical protein